MLPVFFVLHGFTDNYDLVPVSTALFLALKYLVVAFLLARLCGLLYRNFNKANLIAFFIIAFNFFFGSIHDFLKAHFAGTFIVSYSFILPASAIFLLILIIYIKRSKSSFTVTAKYLNILFLLLIAFDTGHLALTIAGNKPAKQPVVALQPLSRDSCAKPDIYLIIADEYAGKDELKDIFSFDNTDFENNLTSRGFHVLEHTRSNYNWTIYSMASMLNMSYIQSLGSNILNNKDMFLCTGLIKNNKVTDFLKKSGYGIYNYSFFDVHEHAKLIKPAFLPSREALITAQTFTSRVYKNLWFNFASPSEIQDVLNRYLNNNIIVENLTRETVAQKSNIPRLVYTHLLMPHPPYHFDRNSKKVADAFLYDDYKLDKKLYLDYLLYTNNKLIELVDYIKINSKNPPVIILMSDHGFRQFAEKEKVDPKYHFMNINAVFLPGGNYAGFYNGMSNVNQFRVILNSQFGQHLSLLSDSTIFLSE
jgi:hypothetical protein